MIKTRRAVLLMLIGLVLMISACGKNIPAINPELLESKKSVLVVTNAGLNEQTAALFQKTLMTWRDTHHIAFEWLPNIAELDDNQLEKMKTSPYDYIIVIGNSLTRQTAAHAAAVTDKKWILLDDAISTPTEPVNGNHIVWKQTGEGFMEKQWQEWVKQQQILGKRIEWVTVSTNPIPSMWAPSEEAEYISLSDAEGWYSQFQLQVKQHYPDWIAIYSPIDPTFMQRIKSLQTPVINMAATSINVQWETELAVILNLIQNQWTPGFQNYQIEEISVNKQS